MAYHNRGLKAITFLGTPRQGSVVVGHSLGMLGVGGSIPGRVKQIDVKL